MRKQIAPLFGAWAKSIGGGPSRCELCIAAESPSRVVRAGAGGSSLFLVDSSTSRQALLADRLGAHGAHLRELRLALGPLLELLERAHLPGEAEELFAGVADDVDIRLSRPPAEPHLLAVIFAPDVP